jgi:hypothetical protein
MKSDFAYTKHQTLRGSMPDADVGGILYLIKNVSEMRLTYQIKLLAYMAKSKNKKLSVRLLKATKVHSSLRDFVRASDGLVKIERT